LAEELGLSARIELVEVAVNSRKLDRDPQNPNPLNQIPTLVLPGGAALYDSDVICDWMAATAGLPPTGSDPTARALAATRRSLAQSMIDQQMGLFRERRRGQQGAGNPYAEAHRAKLAWGLDALEADRGGWMAGGFDLAAITVAAMLAYMDFRHAALDWRAGRSRLAAWYAAVSARRSMRRTEFRE
jgi:glutathione S-transferase